MHRAAFRKVVPMLELCGAANHSRTHPRHVIHVGLARPLRLATIGHGVPELILPILNIYRRYFDWPMAASIAATFYATMVRAGYAAEPMFNVAHLMPQQRNA
jgi:hypothetical protein